jgi:general secretion pathway protein H
MRISATPMLDRRELAPSHVAASGFTVIELLLTLGIVAAVTSVVLISAPLSPVRMDDEIARFSSRLIAARNNAVMQSRPMAVSVTPKGYHFMGYQQGRWQPMKDPAFQPMVWRNGVMGSIGAARSNRVVFDTTGTATQGLAFTLEKGDVRLNVTVDPDGTVRTGS